ncbi:MAG: hypothetical protein WDN01_22595 [Rhizomicrobium sp.]
MNTHVTGRAEDSPTYPKWRGNGLLPTRAGNAARFQTFCPQNSADKGRTPDAVSGLRLGLSRDNAQVHFRIFNMSSMPRYRLSDLANFVQEICAASAHPLS